ncbi:MAG: hypothetical protein Q9201_005506 [Fulgogasparrea decipioides]
MVFVSICTALYDYVPQSDTELELQEGDLVYILEKSSEDDWWKAKKRARPDEDEEPSGLIPNNYVEEARPTHHAKALYDYDRQTDEELSFTEDAVLSVYDTSDQDWTLVGLNGEYGFAPANYIEVTGLADHASSPMAPTSNQIRDAEPESPSSPLEAASPQGPAAALAGIMSSRTAEPPAAHPSTAATVERGLPPRPQYSPEGSDGEPPPPSLPRRPPSGQLSPPPTQYASPRSPDSDGGIAPSPPYNRVVSQSHDSDRGHPSPGGFHLYNINEMVSAIGKKKKLPTTLGLNLATGMIMIAPEKSRDGPQQEWSAEKLTHYSIEGKHVFMELVRPSKSVDFHAGAKDTAQEIVAGLGEIAGAARAEGLREVLEIGAGNAPSSGQKKGQILYDFMAQGDDEVTVGIGDDVIVLDDTKSEEWWMVRRIKNGKEGVVPSSYVEITGTAAPSGMTGINAGSSTVEQNRLEEEKLARETLKKSKQREGSEAKGSEVGPGVKLPERASSLTSGDGNRESPQKSKRSSKDGKASSSSKSKPETDKIRTWTDRSGSFKVEAQFIGLKDGKIHLHKLNGVKIAVPVAKMAIQDLEYVERVTGVSLDDEKPLSDIKRRSTQSSKGGDRRKPQSQPASKSGASIEQPKRPTEPKGPEYDWFDFFLKAGVNPYQCERYAFNFNKDSMDESVLPDITAEVLRTLGLKEGDILRVMKHLDNKFGRIGASSKLRNVSFGNGEGDQGGTTSPTSEGGLFSGPGGALRNNTRKGRPAPAVQSNDVVDAETLKQGTVREDKPKERSQSVSTPIASAPAPAPPKKDTQGFDDDAIWDVKPSKELPSAPQQPSRSVSTPTNSARPQPALTGSMAELSLLSEPLQPTPAQGTGLQQKQEPQPQSLQSQQPAQVQPSQTLPQQPTGANPSFYSQLGQQSSGVNGQQPAPQGPLLPAYSSQQAFQPQQQLSQLNIPRQRPQVPPVVQNSTILPPPPRPLSAPQTQNNNFAPPPLQPQLTGYQPSNQQLQIAPPGQSLNDLNQLRLQQQQQQQQFGQPPLYPQQTGFSQQAQPINQFSNDINRQQTGYGQQPHFQALQPQSTGFQGFQGFQNPQPFINGQQTGSPFADPRPQTAFQSLQPQQTGYQGQFQNNLPTQRAGSINSYLQPALQPQPTGVNGFQSQFSGSSQAPPPIPPVPQQHQAAAPLQPQKTGPPPPVSFGAPAANPLKPQPTGKRANLSQATPQNPFGF